jgi:hypothetical protein
MNENLLSKKIALALFAIVLILLVLNIGITKYVQRNDPPKNKKSLSGIEIDKNFRTALFNYGFPQNWITNKKLKKISGDSLYSAYSIKVPNDVPIQVLILEMQNLFWNDDVTVSAEEITSSKKSLIKISSDNKLKLAAELYYDENVKREYGSISFLVYDLPLQTEDDLKEFFNTPEIFLPVLIPSENSKKRLTTLEKLNKQFALLLNDDIDELNFKMSDNYSDNRIKKSIKEIVGNFYQSLFFIVDDQSDLYKSQKYNLIESELLKRKIKLVKTSELISFSTNNMSGEESFKNIIKYINKDDKKVLLLTADEFTSIVQLLPSFRKIGYRFVYAGDVIHK